MNKLKNRFVESKLKRMDEPIEWLYDTNNTTGERTQAHKRKKCEIKNKQISKMLGGVI